MIERDEHKLGGKPGYEARALSVSAQPVATGGDWEFLYRWREVAGQDRAEWAPCKGSHWDYAKKGHQIRLAPTAEPEDAADKLINWMSEGETDG